MRIPALEFPEGTGLHRNHCDTCGGPIRLMWKGRSGQEYCSNEHLEIGEKAKGAYMTNEDVLNETTAVPVPIKVPAAKKTTTKAEPKKAAPKPNGHAPAKKAAAKKAAPKAAKGKTDKAPAKAKTFPNFREGSTKSKLYAKLTDGKVHTREELYGICDKNNHARALVYHLIDDMKKAKVKVAVTDEGIQIPKAK